MGAAASVGGAAASSASARTLDLDAISLVAHEAAMRLAIAAAKANPFILSAPLSSALRTAQRWRRA